MESEIETNLHCLVCKGDGVIPHLNSACSFCNETGEYTKLSETFLRDHQCQCIIHDRKNCPICGEQCHHNTNGRPKVIVSGGMF
tara:strand:- start:359 stop:610 length:252 start_codon:yes stop_codon:yes gene_type:complete